MCEYSRMSAGTERGGRRRPLIARTALPSLLLWLAASLIGCDHGSVSSSSVEMSTGGTSAGAGALSTGGSLASGGTGIILTPPAQPCEVPKSDRTVFGGRTVSNAAPARRELFTWTTAEQAAELRAGSVLMTRTERQDLGPGYAMVQLQRVGESLPDRLEYSSDTIALAKVLTKFAKDVPTVQFKAALLGGQPVAAAEIQNIANLPSREELVSKLLFLLQSPIRGLATVLAANIRNLAVVIDQVRKQKEETAA